MHSIRKKWVFLSFSILIYLFIILNSLTTGSNSHRLSNNALNNITLFFNFNYNEIYHVILRKAAHICEYFILGLFISLTYKSFYKNNRLLITFGVLICFLLAAFDEFIQHFVPGRAGKATDVLIDSIGFILAIAIIAYRAKKKSPH